MLTTRRGSTPAAPSKEDGRFSIPNVEVAFGFLTDIQMQDVRNALLRAMSKPNDLLKAPNNGISTDKPQVVIFTFDGVEYLGVRENSREFWVREVNGIKAQELAAFFKEELRSRKTDLAQSDFDPILDESAVPVLKYAGVEYLGVPEDRKNFWVKSVNRNTAPEIAARFKAELSSSSLLSSSSTDLAQSDFDPILDEPAVPVLKFTVRKVPDTIPVVFSFTRHLSALDLLRREVKRVENVEIREVLEEAMNEHRAEVGIVIKELRHNGKAYLGILNNDNGSVIVREVTNAYSTKRIAQQYASHIPQLYTDPAKQVLIR